MLLTEILKHEDTWWLVLVDIVVRGNPWAKPGWFGGSGGVAVFIWSRFTSLWLNLCGQHRRQPGYLTRPRGFYHLRAAKPQGGGLCGIEGSLEQMSFKVAHKLIRFLWAGRKVKKWFQKSLWGGRGSRNRLIAKKKWNSDSRQHFFGGFLQHSWPTDPAHIYILEQS